MIMNQAVPNSNFLVTRTRGMSFLPSKMIAARSRHAVQDAAFSEIFDVTRSPVNRLNLAMARS